MTYTQVDWYDLPRYYDLVFREDTDREADFLMSMLEQYGPRRGRRVLEPACGSGRLMQALVRRGCRVAGFDANQSMIDYARRRLRGSGRATVTRGRLESFRYSTRFQLAHCLVSTFKYLLDEQSAAAHLRCVSHVLAPGGIYVLGFHLSEYHDRSHSRERWIARTGRTEVVCNIQIGPPDRRRLERVRSRLRITRGIHRSYYETRWIFRAYDVAQVRSLLRRVPTLHHVATYDFDYDRAHPCVFDGERLDTVLVLRRK